ncbi:Ig-like domain-containing protein [Georgenia sp. EYE_87]|uniref:Ig-like domain-containing protein n=1 Tax=Georgenia sp. EYE_87 TaxID=2853448 RepID=UPI00200588F4|nr:Ig-like domain-containing protein [Georgenia sp. EYE_87]MCK6209405.1 Ig-like domain-containing protein [Georgenia sp. EYE_87]
MTVPDAARSRADSHGRLRTAALVLAALLGWSVLVPTAAAEPVDAGYRDFSYSTSISAPTGDKPQSKLWHNDGSWWGVLYNATSKNWEIFRLDRASQTWTTTGTAVETRKPVQSDVLWSGGKLYVMFHVKATSSLADVRVTMTRLSYDAQAKKYATDAGFPVTVTNKKVESAVIDRDSTGTLWMAYTDTTGTGRSVFVTRTNGGDGQWMAPYVLPTAGASTLGSDDIATLVATGGKVGVLWSNQTEDRLYFATHDDGTGDTAADWSLKEALCDLPRCADDHLNIKSVDAASGQVFAAVKTSLNDGSQVAGDPLIVLYRFDIATAQYTARTVWTVAQDVTRAVVVLDAANSRAHVFGAAPCCSGGVVYSKNISFDLSTGFEAGLGTPVIKSALDPKVNNVTSTKQSVTTSTGLVVLAGDDSTRYYLHAYLPLGEPPTPPPDTTAPSIAGVVPADGATDVSVTPTVSATFDEDVDPASVTASTFTLEGPAGMVPAAISTSGRTVTLTPQSALAENTSYTATLHGGTNGIRDLAGNVLASDRTWTFTTAGSAPPPPPPPPSETVTLTPTADAFVRSTTPGANYGASNILSADKAPVDVSYLRFDLRPYAGRTVTSATLQLRVTTSGSTGTQTVKLVPETAWTESTLTYSTRPATGTTLGSLASTTRHTTYVISLTASELTASLGSELTLALNSTTSSDGVEVASREQASYAPRLTLTFS